MDLLAEGCDFVFLVTGRECSCAEMEGEILYGNKGKMENAD